MARTQGSHSHITKPRILSAALRLFAQNGYAAVSMRQIATEVGVQAGALYNYIPDKQSLLFDLMQSHLQELLEARARITPPADPVEALQDFTRFHIRFHAARPDQVFIAYMELRNLTPDNFAAIEQLRRTYEAELESILRTGTAAGLFDVTEPRIATMALIAMLTGVNTWYRDQGRLSLTAVEDVYCDMITRTVQRSS